MMRCSRAAWEAVATVVLLGATVALLVVRGWSSPLREPSEAPKRASGPQPLHPVAVSSSPSPQVPVAERLEASLEQDAAMPARANAVASYTMQVALDPVAHTLVGSSRVRWKNVSATPVQELYLHLYLNAFKTEQSTFLAERVIGGRGTGALRDAGSIDIQALRAPALSQDNLWPAARPADAKNPADETDMHIPLPSEVAAGAELELEISWTSKLPAIVERSGYEGTFHMVAQWFPKIAKLNPDGTFAHFPYHHLGEFYADYGDYDVTIRVPATYTVGATGRRVHEAIEGSTKVVRHVQHDVHDFAFTAWDGFEEHLDEANGIAIRSLAPRGYGRTARAQVQAAAFGLQHFADRYGAYHYEVLTIVHPPAGAEEAGGMEYPTLITTGGPWYAPSWVGWTRALTLHELAHQYFYGLVGSDEVRWPMLDEGLATYAELEAQESGWGAGSAFRAPGLSLSATAFVRVAALQGGQDDVIAQPARSFSWGRSYATLVYARSALLLETVARAYGAGAWQALGRYARRYRYEHPEPAHLLGAVRDVLGEEAAEALRVGMFERGWIDFAISDLRCASEAVVSDGYRCEIVLTRRGSMRLPVQVQLLLEDGSLDHITWDGAQAQHTVEHSVRSPIVAAVVDPEHRILLDEDLANNAMTTRGRAPAWRVQATGTAIAGLVFATVMR